MDKPKPDKRNLKFADFEQMFREIDSLNDKGYSSNGNWNLAQTCGHLTEWMRFPVDGFPKQPFFMRVMFWLMKVTVGPGMKRKILANGFSGGMPTAPETVPAVDAKTDAEAIQIFRDTVKRVTAHKGELHPSPLFGPMDMETLKSVTLLHAEHHLGYLQNT